MRNFSVKISLILLLQFIFFGCNVVKKVPANKYLLTENIIYVNDVKTTNNKLYNYLNLTPNKKLLGYPLKLGVYNLSKDNADSLYIEKLKRKPKKKEFLRKFLSKKQTNRFVTRKKNFNDWLKNAGEEPKLVNKTLIKKGQKKLEAYFWNKGWFNISSSYKIIPTDSLKAKVAYYFNTQKPYIVDTIDVNIASKVADSIYHKHAFKSNLNEAEQYNTDQLELERNRITKNFRNNGLFHFERDYIKFEADTIDTNKKVNLTLNIANIPSIDDVVNEPISYKVHKISKVKIHTTSNFKNKNSAIIDTTYHNGFELYSHGELKYKPKAITDVVFTIPGEVYKDSLRTLTYNTLNNLGVFKYPTINFEEDPNDEKKEDLIANILLTPRKKYAIGFDFDVSTSVIQDIGLSFGGSLLARNVFKRAESFEISAYSSIGSSSDIAEEGDNFFNISDLGLDAKLSFPRILFPIKVEKFIKKSSSPKTEITIGINNQRNIGLDKESVTSSFIYKWKPTKAFSNQFNLFDLQYVRNLNPGNYFNVYTNSYNTVNEIAQDVLDSSNTLFNDNGDLSINNGSVDSFINSALRGQFNGLNDNDIDDIASVEERKERLTEDNLILSSSYSFIKDTRSNLYDENFARFRFKVESSGLLLNLAANLSDSVLNENGSAEIFNVEYSQFIKFETEYIKRWELANKNVIAFRAFSGIAIPYGNSNSIPFSQSYFGGGSNDIRAWTAYSLGPGTSGGENEFNEANFKLLFNLEYRYDIFGALKGALFVDGGNIWNVLDQFEEESNVSFTELNDLDNIALGIGTGLRYDFDFFVLRLDAAWKLHNPDENRAEPWLRELNFSKTVLNVGINYPF